MKVATAQAAQDLLPIAMRDTARIVAEMCGNSPPPLQQLREQCEKQVASLREELLRRGQPRDVVDDAVYAQCALLDETALRQLSDADRDTWEREPLQLNVFGRNDAGEELLRRIGQRLREPRPVAPLLRIFAAVLVLGFKGRFAVNEAEARTKLIRAIDDRLKRVVGAGAPDRTTSIVVNPSRGRGRPISPIAWVVIACVAAGLVWLAIDRWLLSVIAGMAL